MLLPSLPRACQKAREAVSLELDGELSELGSARLAAHLRDCETCAAYASDLTTFTAGLRSAPLESPRTQIAIRRSRRRAGVAATAAAAVAVAAGLSVTVQSLRGGGSAPRPVATVFAPRPASSSLLFRQRDPLEIATADQLVDRTGPIAI